MNKSQRIYLNTGTTLTDKYIITQLEQEVNTIEFMSMEISTKDAYQNFNSDYGVLVGRVNANGGVGIPNAKISIFIPLTDDDADIGEIASIYPYKTPRDKNAQGKRYNLLPRVSSYEQNTGLYKPKQPFGSFPIKPEIVTNQAFLNVYKKYYKYTALTNGSGDYMIFGVPVGTQTVHMSVDITDIGKYSMTPAAMVTNLGYSPNFFTNNNTEIKPSNDLNDLPNIETQEITVNIIPFWGDSTTFTIGITRQDFRMRAQLITTFILFGSAFTDGQTSAWGAGGGVIDQHYSSAQVDELYLLNNDVNTPTNELISIASKRNGVVTEKIYYYPPSITDAQINAGVDPAKMLVLDKSEYTKYTSNGDFVYLIKCNRNKVITNEFGVEITVPESYNGGVYNQFRGFMTFEISNDTLPLDSTSVLGDNYKTTIKAIRYRFKIPQTANVGHSFGINPDGSDTPDTDAWRKENMTFNGGKIYSVAKFNPIVFNREYGSGQNDTFPLVLNNGFLSEDSINSTTNPLHGDTTSKDNKISNVGLIETTGIDGELPANIITPEGTGTTKFFGANWLNFTLYFPQVRTYFGGPPQGFTPDFIYGRGILSTSHYNQDFYINQADGSQNPETLIYYTNPNTQLIAATDVDTKRFARSDIHYTDFIEVSPLDINKFNTQPKGFILPTTLPNYRNGFSNPTPYQGGRINAVPTNPKDSNTYFYKGFAESDCIKFLISLGLL